MQKAHSGGQYEWDSAAPVGVARSAGCHCSRLDGAPLVYNQPDSYLPDLLVCRPELADAVLAASVFHFRQLTIGQVKAAMAAEGITVR